MESVVSFGWRRKGRRLMSVWKWVKNNPRPQFRPISERVRKFIQLSFCRCLMNFQIYPPVTMLISDTRRVKWDIASRLNKFSLFGENDSILSKKWKIDSDGSRYLIRRVSCHWSTLSPANKFESSLNSLKTRVELSVLRNKTRHSIWFGTFLAILRFVEGICIFFRSSTVGAAGNKNAQYCFLHLWEFFQFLKNSGPETAPSL